MSELKILPSPDVTKEISGGFLVPIHDTHLGKWQIEEDKLDHDNFLPPLVCAELNEGDVIIDLGAFNGDHSIAYSRKVGEKGIVMAVEAGELAFHCLKHNAGLFEHKNVFPLHSCISDFCGESVTHSTSENLGASVATLIPREKLVEGERYLMTVTVDYLASLVQKPINFIKMDIEGWEVKALIGASHTLKNNKPKMLIEVNQEALKNQGSTPGDIFAILKMMGYEWKIVQPECKLGDPMFDILCTPSETGVSRF